MHFKRRRNTKAKVIYVNFQEKDMRIYPVKNHVTMLDDGKCFDYLYVLYNSITGKIEPAQFDADEGAYTIVQLRRERPSKIIDPIDPYALDKAALMVGDKVINIPKCDCKDVEIEGTGQDIDSLVNSTFNPEEY